LRFSGKIGILGNRRKKNLEKSGFLKAMQCQQKSREIMEIQAKKERIFI
jgi:hypothetical protein